MAGVERHELLRGGLGETLRGRIEELLLLCIGRLRLAAEAFDRRIAMRFTKIGIAVKPNVL